MSERKARYSASLQRGSKYGAVASVFDGRRYDSQIEAAVAAVLDALLRDGTLYDVRPQVRFDLGGGVVYWADFAVLTGQQGALYALLLEVKGHETEAWTNKEKQVRALYPQWPLHVVKSVREVRALFEGE